MSRTPMIVSFAAPSGTGKTTLITRLLTELKARGHRVGAIKSDAHRVELDTPGKDTHRMRAAGAEVTALVSRDQLAFFRDAPGPEIPLAAIVELFFQELDIVLAEGFRQHGHPTIVVRRGSASTEGWAWPTNVIAIASDAPDERAPRFELDDVAGLASLVEELARDGSRQEAPGGAS